MSRVTLWAMNNNYHVLDDIILPSEMDKQDFIDQLLYSCGQLIPWIQEPNYLKHNINLWFKRMRTNFERMYIAMNEEYNPLHNYDRYEDWNDVGSSKSTSKADSNNKSSNTSENKVSAFNSTNYQPDNKNEGTNESNFNSNSLAENSVDNTHKGHLYGNIGVTTSAQMLEGEMNVRKLDLYKTISILFQHEFLLEVW